MARLTASASESGVVTKELVPTSRDAVPGPIFPTGGFVPSEGVPSGVVADDSDASASQRPNPTRASSALGEGRPGERGSASSGSTAGAGFMPSSVVGDGGSGP